MGVTSDNSEAQGTRGDQKGPRNRNGTSSRLTSSFAPPPLLEKKTLVCLLCVSHMYEMLKMAFFTSMPYPTEKYLRPNTDQNQLFLKTKLRF